VCVTYTAQGDDRHKNKAKVKNSWALDRASLGESKKSMIVGEMVSHRARYNSLVEEYSSY